MALALAAPALEHAIAHDVEELCSSFEFDRGLSGELDEDDDNEGDDPMVGVADGGDDLPITGVNSSSGTADAKVWVSVPISIQPTYGQQDDIVLDQFILNTRRKSSWPTEKSVLSLRQVRADFLMLCVCTKWG